MRDWDLYGIDDTRKYLTATERTAFLKAIPVALSRNKRTFALMLFYTGCRISECLGITYDKIDYKQQGVVLKTLKRKKKVYRFVPLPPLFLEKLDDVHFVKDKKGKDQQKRIWPFNRKTGWSAIKAVMSESPIEGIQATAHGLRHSFIMAHQVQKTPSHLIQEWVGWTSTEMLGVYGRAVGAEEREMASGIW